MSIAGILDAMRSDRAPAERLVWICLENHANGHRCWPMTERAIAAELNLSIPTVQRAVQSLVAGEIVRVEQHKRRPTVFHMLRAYPKANGQHPPPEDLAYQNDMSTPENGPELTHQNDMSTASDAELTYQNDTPNPSGLSELTYQFDTPTPELTPKNDTSTPELTYQFDTTKESTSKNPTSKNPPTARAGARSESVHPLFNDFWESYPRKVGKRDASAAFTAAVKRADSAQAIIDALRLQPFHHNPQFIPHPATWLRGDRWLDKIEHPDAALMRAVGLNPDDLWRKGGLLQ
jgi:hypothetical protein